ncbi:MAG: phosphoglucosamine mutase [Gammaproteobacteria bacterium]|nr:phosphoglucosamine mutase [Gammaproteobacteria bacterium]
MPRKYFGTDGIRGLVGEEPITPNFVMQLGWAAGKVFEKQSPGDAKILIGKDTRISGYMFESALEAGLSAAGVDVRLLGPMPTPAIAYLTRTFHAQAGIVISASHNAYHDNGIKFFAGAGTKLPDEVELEIESYLDMPMTTMASNDLGKVKRIEGARGRYIEFCKSTVPYDLRLKGLKVVLDCANGATYHIAPDVFDELGAEVIPLAVKPDGFNINAECGSTSPKSLQEAVLENKADLGIAFDGDGDRVVMVDHAGKLVDGDELLYVIARDNLEAKRMRGGVVGTLMSNLGLEVALTELGAGFVRANVGDRHVMELLRKEGWSLGGESSGHIICLDKTTTGDGIIAALQVVAAMQNRGVSLREMLQGMEKYPQKLVNVRMQGRCDPLSNAQVCSAVADAESELGQRGRVLLRMSGTEPVVRVMVEGVDGAQVSKLADGVAEVVRAALG